MNTNMFWLTKKGKLEYEYIWFDKKGIYKKEYIRVDKTGRIQI